MIAAAWAEQKAIKKVMIFLQGVGASTSLTVRIYKKYGDASFSVGPNEPYRLAADVWGIGFKDRRHDRRRSRDRPGQPRADQGRPGPHPFRGRRQPLLPVAPNLIADATKILDVSAELIAPCLDELAAADGWSANRCALGTLRRRPIAQVARELGINEGTLATGVNADRRGGSAGKAGPPSVRFEPRWGTYRASDVGFLTHECAVSWSSS